jgi:hypothetical protein
MLISPEMRRSRITSLIWPPLPFLVAPLPYKLFIRLIRSSGSVASWRKQALRTKRPEPVSCELRRTPFWRSSRSGDYPKFAKCISSLDRAGVSFGVPRPLARLNKIFT